MGLRPGHCYRSKKDRAYSRYAVTVHDRNYIGAVPGVKTRQFNMGNPVKQFTRIVDLVVDGHIQIRDNAIESTRIAVNRFLHKRLGKEGYFMRIRIYPFQILRENKQAQGAGADRVSQGMSLSFGGAIGRAARVRPGQKIISVLVDESGVETAKKGLMRANAKMPVDMHVIVGTDVESIGTRPREVREITVEQIQAEEAEAKEKAEKKGAKKEGKKEEKKGEAAPTAAAAGAGAAKEEPKKEEKKGEKK